jgi:hypothetical protein
VERPRFVIPPELSCVPPIEIIAQLASFTKNYGDLRDFVQEYEEGLMTAEAKAIYEAILENGPLNTVRLRRESRMSAQSAKTRFDRALVGLQAGSRCCRWA